MSTSVQMRALPEPATADLVSLRVRRVAACWFLGMLTYAVIRYHVFGGVPWSQVPLYTVNKAVAFTSAVLLCIAATNRGRVAGEFGKLGFAGCLLHGAMSIAMLSPAAYPKLFLAGNGPLSLDGQVAVLAGFLSIVLFLLPAATSFGFMRVQLGAERVRRYRSFCTLALMTLGAHLFAMGFQGWLDVANWPGALPPITILSFAVVGGSLAVRIRRKRRGS